MAWSEVVQEPTVQLGKVPLKNGLVPIVAGEVGINTRNRLCQPLTVAKRNERVLAPVPQLHRDLDRAHLETPGMQLRHAVVPPSFASRSETGVKAADKEFSQLWRTHPLRKLIRSQREHRLPLRPETGSRGGFIFEHELDVVDVRRLHAGEVIESSRSVRGRRCEDPDRDHAAWQERPTCKCVRSPAGHAPHGQAIDSEGVRDGADILGAISYRAAWTRRRSTVPGPVVGNESKPLSQRIGDVGAVENARAWRPMHNEDGLAVWIAGFFAAEETATRRTHQPLHAA